MALLPLAIAAALGAAGMRLVDKFRAAKIQSAMAPLPGGQPSAQVTVLQNGRPYIADMLIDPSGFPTKDPQNNAQPIADALGSVGMAVMTPPQPRTSAETAKFQQNQPARMFAIFRWTNADGAPGALPGFVKQVNFYDVPSAA